MSGFREYPSRDALYDGLAAVVATQLQTALNGQGHATLAVPGGTTPGPFFERLRRADLNWANVTVMLTDERFVPETSDRSNTALLRRTFLQDNAAAARLAPLVAAGATPEDVLDDVMAGVAAALPLDVCVLGMGADMHTASLFPGADRLDDALAEDAPILVAMRADGAPEPRITLSAPVLRGAGAAHILIVGPEKRSAVQQAKVAPNSAVAPVRVVLDSATIHWAE